jgi:hypothetical protein
MSTTGTWAVPSRAFGAALEELRDWRDGIASSLAGFRRWATVARAMDEQTAARLAYLERRLAGERLTIAFVGEYSRGKTELINALFFSDLGARLLPSGLGRTTLCPTEILWDPARPASLRLLPIETRASPQALREFVAQPEAWHEVPLDPSNPAAVAHALEAISETRVASDTEAANLGLPVEEGEGAGVVPRWRYAIVNFPHPMLESGLVILDTPGHNTMGVEPEVSVHRVPDAAAIVFMLGADTGVTRSDRELWSELIEPVQGLEQGCFVVLNKIDGLRDGFKSETHVLADIDKQVRSTAEALHVMPTRVFALSARQGLVARIQADRDALIRSRIYRLEQALAQQMVHQRRSDHAATVRAETRAAFAESRALIESRLAFGRDQLHELLAIQGRNQRLVESLARKASSERTRLEHARAVLVGARTVHNRQADQLAALLDPNAARESAIAARREVLDARFSSGIGEALDRFFRENRTRIREAVVLIDEARVMMATVARKFSEEYAIGDVEVAEFGTDRFFVELDRLEARCALDFKGTASLLTRRRSTLGALFFDTIALKAVHVFEIADREVRTWMSGFIRPLDARLTQFQELANGRIEGMGRIQNAETDLVTRLDELRALVREVQGQLGQWREHQERLDRLVEASREPSL